MEFMSKSMPEQNEQALIEPEVTAIVEQAPSYMVIENFGQTEQVSKYLKQVRECRKRISEWFAPMRENAHRAWKAIVARESELDSKPAEVEAACKRMLAAWQDKEQERIRIEQKKLDDDARKAAAAAAMADGDKKQAAAITSGKVAVVSTTVVQASPKLAGVSTRSLWQAEVTDKMALIKAVAQGKCPQEYLTLNMTALNAVARSTRGQVTIPGVQIRQVTSIAARN